MPLVRAGRLLKAHGVQGFMKLGLSGDNPVPLDKRGRLWAYDSRSGELLELRSPEVRALGEETACLLRCEGWTAPEAVAIYQGCEVLYLAGRGELPREPDEVYFFELIGLEVRSPEGRVLARVADVLETGAGILLELDSRPVRLIPFTARDVPVLDIAGGFLVTNYAGLPSEDAL